MKKQNPIKLKDLSELGKVISFSKVDETSYDAPHMKDLLMEVGIAGKVRVTNIDYEPKPHFITIEQVVKDFTKNEQGQQAFDKLNKK